MGRAEVPHRLAAACDRGPAGRTDDHRRVVPVRLQEIGLGPLRRRSCRAATGLLLSRS